ncbi:hypothetical protein BAUCODRAFT_45007, partial [Baudoinia panamericana UAMH 10762]
NEQAGSSLFNLPRELRDIVWAYATAPYEDPQAKFEESAYYCRPGHIARLKSDVALLLTCRRIWLEANAMPMLQAEHLYYFYRPAPDERTKWWMAQLSDHNRANFGHLHMYAQMCNIERLTATPGALREFFLSKRLQAGDFQPRVFHVTIRHTDWWYWEREAPLRLADRWVVALLNTPDLRSTKVLKLELETLDYKVDQLKPIVERLRDLNSEEKETHIINGKPQRTKFVLHEKLETFNWEGPANIDGKKHAPYADKSRLRYHVVTLTWHL